jgi:hypothetical protein
LVILCNLLVSSPILLPKILPNIQLITRASCINESFFRKQEMGWIER